MIESLYAKYFQKSRSFLYPLLGIRKGRYSHPSATYISIEGIIEPDEMKLICAYKEQDEPGFKAFEKTILTENKFFSKMITIDGKRFYVFNLEPYKIDWYNFIMGKYSLLSSKTKAAIEAYYGTDSSEYSYMETYLHPDKYYEHYATLLDVSIRSLKKGVELCDPCDIDKETLRIPVDLQLELRK